MAPRLGQVSQRAAEKPTALELRPLRLSIPALLCGLGRAADHLSFRVLICEMGQQEACKSGGACRAPALDSADLGEQSALWSVLADSVLCHQWSPAFRPAPTSRCHIATSLPLRFRVPCVARALSLFILTLPSFQPGSPPPRSMEASALTQGGLSLSSSGGKESGRPPAGWFVSERETDRRI